MGVKRSIRLGFGPAFSDSTSLSTSLEMGHASASMHVSWASKASSQSALTDRTGPETAECGSNRSA
jgi:hypothetical protein